MEMQMGCRDRRMCWRKKVDTPRTGVVLVRGDVGTKAPLKKREEKEKGKRREILC